MDRYFAAGSIAGQVLCGGPLIRSFGKNRPAVETDVIAKVRAATKDRALDYRGRDLESGHWRGSKRIEPGRPRRTKRQPAVNHPHPAAASSSPARPRWARRQPGVEQERNPGNGCQKRVSAPTGREERLGPIVPAVAAGCSCRPVGAGILWGPRFPRVARRSTLGSQLARRRRACFRPNSRTRSILQGRNSWTGTLCCVLKGSTKSSRGAQ